MSGHWGVRSERILELASCSAIGVFISSLHQAPPECESLSWWRTSKQPSSSKPTPVSPEPPHDDILEGKPRLYSPLSPIRIFRPNPNLEIAFDVRSRNPLYVLERLDPYSVGESRPLSSMSPFTYNPGSGSGGKNSSKRPRHRFYESTMLPEEFRSRNSSYHRSGYDRGHLAAAANYSSPESVLDTYNLCNVSPQDPRLNSTVWARLEDWTRRVAVAYYCSHGESADPDGDGCCDTYVVTGPLWLPVRTIQLHQPQRRLHEEAEDDETSSLSSSSPASATTVFEYQFPALGVPPNLVSVPTHFFKLVVVVRQRLPPRCLDSGNDNACECYSSESDASAVSPIVAYACFVVPNRNVLEEHSDWSFEDGLVRWTDLEAATGLEFFPELVDRDWKRAADDALMGKASKRKVQQRQRLLLLPPPTPPSSSSLAGEQARVEVAATNSRKEKLRPSKLGQSAEVSHLCPGGSCPRY